AGRRARRDRVAGDAVAAEVAGDDAGEAGDASLRGAVVRLPGETAKPGDGREVDDAPVALLPHEDRGGLRRAVVPLQVHGDDVVPLLLAHVEDHPVAQDPGDVDQDVDASEVVERRLDQPLAALDRRDGVEIGYRLAAGGADFVRDLRRRPAARRAAIDVHAVVVDDDVRAFLRQQHRDAAADAAPAAG